MTDAVASPADARGTLVDTMRPEGESHDPSGQGDDSDAFMRGVKLGYQLGRDEGFGEGVRAMHRAIAKALRGREHQSENGKGRE